MTPEALDKQFIDTVVAETAPTAVSVEVRTTVESTNEVLLRRAATENLHACALLAEQQTRGRGRSGRNWVSPPSNNVYLSIAWHFPQGLQVLAGLSLAVGVAVAQAIDEVCGVSVQLKWPNDIVHPSGKLGGVLIETVAKGDGGCTAILGVGLNVGMSGEQASTIDQPWIALNDLSAVSCSRNVLAGRVIANLSALLSGFVSSGFSAWQARWESLDALRGHRVTADGPEVIEGIASGVASDGGLKIATDEGERVIYAGEARLRKPGVSAA